ncbi:DUF4279 domain-containing protein [Nostoc sp. FACHB-152]|uniref:DUF4279 domain-containing protein n=1 Tax=unclassified Nostoc TaxID=2593658 RepID=UPI001686B34A|nr:MULTISPECIES: DUF4279 domain-containing protein [unclassified Nostoc]MBD2447943.1 DUF4279 domain-containing protein [Nostoc sp. FACHB-152]MBD2468483.1 DUF4279 domain-containing protein [Nostoc sp. FACHB-145]
MEDVLIFGGSVDKTSVCLAVYGEELNPDEISKILSCQPTKAHHRGVRQDSNSKYTPYKSGAWLLNVKRYAPITADELIIDLLSRVPTNSRLWQELSAIYDVQVRIGIHMKGWNKGFNLQGQTVQRISELGASMVFDIYAYGDEEDNI